VRNRKRRNERVFQALGIGSSIVLFLGFLGYFGPQSASAAMGDITEFPLVAYSRPSVMVAGPDGNLWFTEGGSKAIGRMSTSGELTDFAVSGSSASYPSGIAVGPDSNLWFTDPGSNTIGRITLNGQITKFSLPTPSRYPNSIVAGPDGNLWFTENGLNRVGRMSPTGEFTEFPVSIPASELASIAAGPDGNLWVAGRRSGKIVRITPTGDFTDFPTPRNSFPVGLIAGPDGNLWFTAESGTHIGWITPKGQVATLPTPTTNHWFTGLGVGPDNNIWYAATNMKTLGGGGGKFGRVTLNGQITEYPRQRADSRPTGVVAGPDGNIWFTDYNFGFSLIGRLEVSTTPPSSTTTTTLPPTGTLGVRDIQITASPTDRLLSRAIKVIPTDPSLVARYEYSWTTTPSSNIAGPIQRCAVTITTCRLHYGPTRPNTRWNLLARVVGTDGRKSTWLSRRVQTPKAPILIVFGDSIASGHHRDREGSRTICQDERYSYGQTIWSGLQGQLPPQWRVPHGYINVAISGFGTTKAIEGDAGDACGDRHKAELPTLIKRLQQNAGSWNWVVGTLGIDDTNWGDVLVMILEANSAGLMKSEDLCRLFVDGSWNLQSDPSLQTRITANVQTITSKVAKADPAARSYWTGYYNIAGTGTSRARIPRICKVPFEEGIHRLHDSIKAGLTGGFTFVNIDVKLGLRDNLLQDLYPSDLIYKKSGWPHPNRTGATRIGESVLAH
jgi:streptogramin lyase